VENRLAGGNRERPGAALIALAVILLITAAWWALALWPAGALEPEWLTRTRAACFGSPRGGLPDAGGWILLIGEPIGMLAALIVGWGRSLARDVRWMLAGRVRRFAVMGAATVLLLGATSLTVRTARAWTATRAVTIVADGSLQRVDLEPPTVELVDQALRPTALADFRGRPAILTVAFAHCSTVCPLVVSALQSSRRLANRLDIPIVIITLDPWRDTPDRLATIARQWSLGPSDRVLSGSVADVERMLDELQVGRGRNETTGDVDHTAPVMLMDERGRITWRATGRRVSELLQQAR
jgi:protein SCO1/2